jgi:glycerophosphoryl diester phosphodiesterase
MKMHPKIETGLQTMTDTVCAFWPRTLPAAERLAHCKLIAHRGEHDSHAVMENTLAAFEKAEAAGVWGIELDVRWTADQVPVVFHDPDLRRLYGVEQRLDGITAAELQSRFPAIPTLSAVVERFGGRMHMMIELKRQPFRDIRRQRAILQETLSPLEPGRDFHLLALTPHTLVSFAIAPPEAFVAVAYYWPGNHSHWVVQSGWGGVCAHYLFMPKAMIRKHHRHRQCVGTGYAVSRNCLYRELNRGVDWIFTNQATELQTVLDDHRRSSRRDRTERSFQRLPP